MLANSAAGGGGLDAFLRAIKVIRGAFLRRHSGGNTIRATGAKRMTQYWAVKVAGGGSIVMQKLG
jgi:hypothetical protein